MVLQKAKFATGMLVIMLLLLFGNNVKAQNLPADKIAQALNDSLAYLQLTSDQLPTAQQLNTTAASALVDAAKKAKTDTSFRGKELAKQVFGIMKQRNDGLKKILSGAQQTLYDQHKVSQLADLQTKLMTAQLDLTDEQVPKVAQLNQKEMAATMEDMQKLQSSKGKLGKMMAAKSLKGDSKEKDKALKKVLTSDQYAIYEKHQEEIHAAIKQKMQEKKDAAK
jgi:hypothetical protein